MLGGSRKYRILAEEVLCAAGEGGEQGGQQRPQAACSKGALAQRVCCNCLTLDHMTALALLASSLRGRTRRLELHLETLSAAYCSTTPRGGAAEQHSQALETGRPPLSLSLLT